MRPLAWLRPDLFTLALVSTVGLATLLPVRGAAILWLTDATQIAVALVFFLHGARLSRESVRRGLGHWRLHLAVLAASFALMPLLGLLATRLPSGLLPPALASGVLFLCCLPSTMQAAVAFTSIAGGNVPAALCGASLSNLIGVFATPLLVALLMGAHGQISAGSIEAIVLRILVPFAFGQALHPLIGPWLKRHALPLVVFDRGSILLVVYGAFSDAVETGLWPQLSPAGLAAMALVDLALLGLVIGLTTLASRAFGFSREDEIAIVFCGSKKSLVAGIPMANILFAGRGVGLLLLPLMLFHQIQLLACAMLARRYAERGVAPAPAFEPAR